jgi:hypothetical protein
MAPLAKHRANFERWDAGNEFVSLQAHADRVLRGLREAKQAAA